MGDPGSIPGLGGSPEEGNGYSLQYFCLEFHGQRSLAGYIYSPWSHKELDITEWLSTYACRLLQGSKLNFQEKVIEHIEISMPYFHILKK